jgi:hypothetical protein
MAIRIPAGHGRYRIEDSDQAYVLAKGLEHRSNADVSTIVVNDDASNDKITINGLLDQVGTRFPAASAAGSRIVPHRKIAAENI